MKTGAAQARIVAKSTDEAARKFQELYPQRLIGVIAEQP